MTPDTKISKTRLADLDDIRDQYFPPNIFLFNLAVPTDFRFCQNVNSSPR